MKTTESTKVAGWQTVDMAKALKGTLMVMCTKDVLRRGKPVVKVFTIGRTGRCTKGSGCKVKNAVRVNGKVIVSYV
jgi:hypothetical protein